MCSLIKAALRDLLAFANHAANISNTESIPLIYLCKMLIGAVSEPQTANNRMLVSAAAPQSRCYSGIMLMSRVTPTFTEQDTKLQSGDLTEG